MRFFTSLATMGAMVGMVSTAVGVVAASPTCDGKAGQIVLHNVAKDGTIAIDVNKKPFVELTYCSKYNAMTSKSADLYLLPPGQPAEMGFLVYSGMPQNLFEASNNMGAYRGGFLFPSNTVSGSQRIAVAEFSQSDPNRSQLDFEVVAKDVNITVTATQ